MNINEIFSNDPTGEQLVKFAEQTANQLVRGGLGRSQIRNIFTEVRKIEASWDTSRMEALHRLNMLKPKLDYQTARTEQVRPLRDVLVQAIDEVNKAKTDVEYDARFQCFMDLFEAILAYHRAFGGRN